AWIGFLADRRAPQDVAPLEDEHLASGPGQVGGASQPVVPGADDDRVIDRRHQGLLLRSGSKKGFSTRRAATGRRSWSTVCSSSTLDPSPAWAALTLARPSCRL